MMSTDGNGSICHRPNPAACQALVLMFLLKLHMLSALTEPRLRSLYPRFHSAMMAHPCRIAYQRQTTSLWFLAHPPRMSGDGNLSRCSYGSTARFRTSQSSQELPHQADQALSDRNFVGNPGPAVCFLEDHLQILARLVALRRSYALDVTSAMLNVVSAGYELPSRTRRSAGSCLRAHLPRLRDVLQEPTKWSS
ncbi:hypothetical protein CONLIGDRAFT_369339 [Coniochaeta ligniaria NRRL 30616]|uniref:Uncharacterized protein n=1 Tax=Coniochaeta ligniaria NRRL 30616 TaxID=1408157 RepID=A0A1J7JKP8_9PEZI|nr:hypothetical protein CONLIGDRAFT_369339 [Coniochaeta ligniaria NRRL 30616]